MTEPAAEPVPEPPPSSRSGLSPLRRTLLDHLTEAASASELARRLDLPRQKVNYHLRELERLGLVELVDERRRRGFVERRMRTVDRDRFSSAYLYTAASRLAGDVATLRERAAAADRALLTFTLELDIDFASPAAMRDFLDELTTLTRTLAARHHRPDEPRARRHHVVIGAHPVITKTPEQAAAEAAGAAEPREAQP
ncbi:ArsR/SmtB family transcription factor [Actinomadura sp. 9N407]|uniref:ArsR/SmtB family transcription factor n=1 Tax=Actinomadura sp. 9N407 TaxID=3375154 RepID=UPI0037BD5E98